MKLTDVKLNLPRGCEAYLALQRTAYQHPVNRFFRRLRLDRVYDTVLLPRIERHRGHVLCRLYDEELRADYRSIAAVLPEAAAAILDIGCGIAGIDVFLSNHYHRQVDLFLLDKDGVSDIYYGFTEKAAFYNSLQRAREFLILNGVDDAHVHAFDINVHGFPSGRRFDIIISLISYGFHYPVRTYVHEVYEALADGGVLILDLRRGTDGEAQLEEVFGANPQLLARTQKFDRVALSKGVAQRSSP
jgi:SAM-dependent methyltransferase